jgi:hypothetical protein
MPDTGVIASAPCSFLNIPFRTYFYVAMFFLLLSEVSCNHKPRETKPMPIHPKVMATQEDIITRDLHEVVVLEALPAERYVYLKVQEGSRDYWIASGNRNAEIGKLYFYREALLKTDFKSKITGSTFDTLYLVTQLVPKEHALGAHAP